MSMFRQKALAKLQSPEQLDEPLKILPRWNGLALLTLAFVALFALGWGSIGAVPVTGRGKGLLLTPGTVMPLQSRAAGQIIQWDVTVGDYVEKGQVIGYLDQPRIRRQLLSSKAKREEVAERNEKINAIRAEVSRRERETIDDERDILKDRIAYLRQYIERIRTTAGKEHEQNLKLLALQRKNLDRMKAVARRVADQLAERFESYQRLWDERLIAEDAFRNARQQLEDARLKIRNLELKDRDLDLREIQINETNVNFQNLITSKQNEITRLELQLQELESREAKLTKSDEETTFRFLSQLRDVERAIRKQSDQLALYEKIKADHSGRVLELTAAEGALVTKGQKIGQVDTRDEDDPLVALTYFAGKEAKKLKSGMEVRVSPSTVPQKDFGSMVGTIKSISEYPVTTSAVVSAVGNSAVAQTLTASDREYEVVIHLKQADTPSGYEWTSEPGPDVELTAGTICDVDATVEQRRPVSYILPKIREWVGF